MKVIIIVCLCVLLQGATAQAQMGRLLKEGIEAVGKHAFSKTAKKAAQEGSEEAFKKVAATSLRKVGQEGSEEALKKAASLSIRRAGQEGIESAAKRAGVAVAHESAIAAKAIGQHGSAIATPLIQGFGDDGAKALVKLSPTNARRMALIAEDLGKSGRGGQWMKLLADKGDVAAEWAWKNKGSIAVGTTAAAFLADPEPFLKTGEVVATTSIETAGKHVAEPLIRETVQAVVPAVAGQATKLVAAPAGAIVRSTNNHPGAVLLIFGLLGLGGLCFYLTGVRPLIRMFWKR